MSKGRRRHTAEQKAELLRQLIPPGSLIRSTIFSLNVSG